MKWTALLFACLFVSGCTDIFGLRPPDDAVRMAQVPAEYGGWWKLTQSCSGATGDFNKIEWFSLPNDEVIPGTDAVVGRYYAIGHQIVIAKGYERSGEVVRHEMLHALVRKTGHARKTFLIDCAGIVRCTDSCEKDAGGAIVRDGLAPIVTSGVLDVITKITPDTVSLSNRTRGCLTVVVSAQNRLNVSVRVRFEDRYRPISDASFGWRIEGLREQTASDGDSIMQFGPREIRRRTFDCAYLGPSRLWGAGLSPGEHSVVGYLRAVDSSQPAVVVVVE